MPPRCEAARNLFIYNTSPQNNLVAFAHGDGILLPMPPKSA